jgi:serine/threonine protein kinase
LTDWLERERRAPAEILAVFARAGLGLAATHAAGVVHRDFKPANVLVGDDDRVLVTDFGIATTADAGGAAQVRDPAPGPRGLTRTCTGEVAGTPAYMAPEQLHGGPVDGRADQFSFCTALWRALFGTPPFPGDTLRELAASIAAGVVRPPPVATAASVSPALRAALERGLSIVPAARFAAMRELLAALAAG